MATRTESRVANPIALAIDALHAFGQLHGRVSGASMLPALRPGDELQFESCTAESVEPGDVVLFQRDGRLIAHRVVMQTATGLLTQGDSVAKPDLPVDRCDVLGRVVKASRHGRAIAHRRSHIGAGMARWLFRRSALATRLFIRLQRPTIRKSA